MYERTNEFLRISRRGFGNFRITLLFEVDDCVISPPSYMSEILPYRDGYSHSGVGELLRGYCRLEAWMMAYPLALEKLISWSSPASLGNFEIRR